MVWKYKGPASWYFVTLPKLLSNKIRKHHGLSEEGWGRLRATAQIGESIWNTAIWYDSKANGYLLPIKVKVRKSEEIEVGTHLRVLLKIEDEVLR